MNAPNLPLLPEMQLGAQPSDQPNLDLASEGVQRYIWHSAYGAMLIEVRDGATFVNGGRVVSMAELRATELEPRPSVARRCCEPIKARGAVSQTQRGGYYDAAAPEKRPHTHERRRNRTSLLRFGASAY